MCPWCGQPDSGGKRCTRCGGSLLVDIAVDPIADERVRFEVARALAAIGPPLKPFAETKAALMSAEQIIARAASTAILSRVNEVLAPFGLTAHAVARGTSPVVKTWALRAAVLLVLCALPFALARFFRSHADATAAVTDAIAPGAQPAKGPPAARAYDQKKVQAAVVQLSCSSQLGSGFFIDSDRVLTNAHVVCEDRAITVGLADGRTLIGKVLERDEWLDYAIVEVSGAGVEPLHLGDSTVLTPGEPISIIGSPQGLSFTWHDGKVSYVGRNHLGIAYLQLDATVNPGNSGGPVVSARGEAVGIVSMKVTTAEGIGLALPIEYVEPPEGEALDRWNTQLARVKRDDDKQAAETSAGLDKPMLVEAKVIEGALVATVMMRSTDGTPTRRLAVELRTGTKLICHESLDVQEWVSMETLLGEQREKLAKNRSLAWVLKSGSMKHLRGAVGVVSLDGCPVETLTAGAELVLPGGGEGKDRVLLSPGMLRQVRRVANVAGAAPSAVDDNETSRVWRKAFLTAHTLVDEARAEVQAATDALAATGSQGAVDVNERRLKAARERLARVEQQLGDLERRAANDSIPLEWRR